MTSIEKFHWLDQNPKLPNYVFATLRFATRIDPEIARQSFAIMLRRQPLAAMEPKRIGSRWCWRPIPAVQFDGERFFSSRDLSDDEASKSLHSLDPQVLASDFTSYFLSVTNFQEPAVQGDESLSEFVSEIRFHSHHASSDGVASIGMINDWLTIYNNLVAGAPAENGLIELDSSSFQNRGVLGAVELELSKRNATASNRIVRCCEIHFS